MVRGSEVTSPFSHLDHDIVLGTFITGVRWLEGAFMHNNACELPQLGPIIILLLDVIEDLIVAENLRILVIIDGAAELELVSIAIEMGIMVFNGLDNACTKSLTILLRI